jgi:hypothetical protein
MKTINFSDLAKEELVEEYQRPVIEGKNCIFWHKWVTVKEVSNLTVQVQKQYQICKKCGSERVVTNY